MADIFTVKGTQAAIENLFREFENDKTISGDPGVSTEPPTPINDTSALRRPLGLEPMTYFVVAYSAHLAADVTMETIRMWLHSRASKSAAKISVEEKKDDNPPAKS
jgi:hypothetical protein